MDTNVEIQKRTRALVRPAWNSLGLQAPMSLYDFQYHSTCNSKININVTVHVKMYTEYIFSHSIEKYSETPLI